MDDDDHGGVGSAERFAFVSASFSLAALPVPGPSNQSGPAEPPGLLGRTCPCQIVGLIARGVSHGLAPSQAALSWPGCAQGVLGEARTTRV